MQGSLGPRFLFRSGAVRQAKAGGAAPEKPSVKHSAEKFSAIKFSAKLSARPAGVSLESALPPETILSLDAEESHHLRNVLRLSESDTIELYDLDSEQSYHAEIFRSDDECIEVKILELLPPSLGAPRIHLIVALVKPDKCELIVEKCTEIGLASILFFRAERSQYQLPKQKAELKLERWSRISVAALKQSRAAKIPELSLSDSLEAALSLQEKSPKPGDVRLRLAAPGVEQLILSAQPPTISQFFRNRSTSLTGLQNLQENADSYIIVGPEGGLTESEVSFANHWAYVPCSLGRNVLRTETAAIVGCGSLQALLS